MIRVTSDINGHPHEWQHPDAARFRIDEDGDLLLYSGGNDPMAEATLIAVYRDGCYMRVVIDNDEPDQ